MRVRVASIAEVGVLTFLLGGCGQPEEAPAFLARDSLGIRIVEMGELTDVSAAISIGSEPLYRVGWERGDRLFEDLVSGDVFKDGRVVVADGRTTQGLILLDRDGGVTAVLGRYGEGPGEYQRIHSVSTVGNDTLLVDDSRALRLTVLERSEVLRTLSLTDFGAVSVLGGTPEGVVYLGPPLLRVAGRRYPTPWRTVPLLTVRLEDLEVDSLGSAEWDQSLEFAGHDPFRSYGFAAKSSDDFVTGRGDVAELRWTDPTGELRQISRWDAKPLPVSDTLWARFEASFRLSLPEATPHDIVDLMITDMEGAHEGRLPLFGDLITDPYGRTWIGQYLNGYMEPPEAGRRYDVFAPDGQHLGPVTVPATSRFRLLAVGHDRILGVELDDLDVQAVVAYPLVN